MKKILTKLILFLIIASLTAIFCSCENNGEYAAPAGYVMASNEDADYCLYVPEDWTVDFSTAAVGAYVSQSDPSSVSVMAWELEYTDSTLEDWWEINKTDIELVFSDVEVISEDNTAMDEIYAKRYVYSASLGENRYKFLQQAVIRGGEVYVFTYTSLEDNYDTHIEEVEDILGFFIFK